MGTLSHPSQRQHPPHWFWVAYELQGSCHEKLHLRDLCFPRSSGFEFKIKFLSAEFSIYDIPVFRFQFGVAQPLLTQIPKGPYTLLASDAGTITEIDACSVSAPKPISPSPSDSSQPWRNNP